MINFYYYWLSTLKGIGLKKRLELLKHFGTVKRIYEAAENDISAIPLISAADRKTVADKNNKETAKRKYDNLKKRGIYFVSIEDNRYPENLKYIYAPPTGLFVKGKLPINNQPLLAMVGARNCSSYGREAALYFAGVLADSGIGIVSGLAAGIDRFSHLGALNASGSTYAVLGCGIDICYPLSNLELYTQIFKEGGIISEYPPGMPAKPGLFPMRNRIISGMSDGVFVLEAGEKSGSLITADLGLEQGKNIYALPGKITDVYSAGCNDLIKQGAKPVLQVSDILEDYKLNLLNLTGGKKKSNKELETDEKIVYASVSFSPKKLDEIMAETQFCRDKTISILVALELKRYVKQIGFYYIAVEESFHYYK